MASHYLEEVCELPHGPSRSSAIWPQAPRPMEPPTIAPPNTNPLLQASRISCISNFFQRPMEPRLKFHPLLRSSLVSSSFRKLLSSAPFRRLRLTAPIQSKAQSHRSHTVCIWLSSDTVSTVSATWIWPNYLPSLSDYQMGTTSAS